MAENTIKIKQKNIICLFIGKKAIILRSKLKLIIFLL